MSVAALRSECPSDDAVAAWLEHRVGRAREAELEAHFEACPRCRAMIAALARPAIDAPDPDEAECFGRYRVRGRIGRGAMGVVERAWDPRLGREVALKRLPVARADRRDRDRLLREARALAKLAHPAIVAVYDVGVVGDELFFAMELVRGQTLAERLAGHALPWRDALALLVPAAEGLAAAHAMGIVHRDFKPANVMISSGLPGETRVLVMDFGLARTLDAPSDPADRTPGGPAQADRSGSSTADGSVVGTPLYMAPEQHVGLPADARADQFAFCVVLFEALCGRRPFAGRTLAELAAKKSGAELEAVPRARGVPRWLIAATLRGLQPDPAARHPSMPALVDVLRRGASRVPISGRIGVAVGLALAFGVWAAIDRDDAPTCDDLASAMTRSWGPAEREQLAREGGASLVEPLDRYVARWQALHADVCRGPPDSRVGCLARSQLALDALVEAVRGADAGARAIDAVDRLPLLERCVEPEPGEPAPPPEQAAAVALVRALHAQAIVRSELGDHDAAQLVAADALARARALGFAPLLAEELMLSAEVAEEAGLPADARAYAAEASEVAEAAGRVQSQVAAALLLAGLALDRSDPDEAERWAQHARARIERGGVDEVTRVDLRRLEATIAAGQDDPAPAAAFERVADDYERLLGPMHSETLSARIEVARLHRRLHDTAAALAAYASLAALAEARWGPRHPTLATIFNNMGAVLADAKRLDEAELAFERAAAIREEVLGPTHRQLASTLVNLANIRHERGRDDEAVPLYRRAIAIWTARLGPEHAVVAEGWYNLAIALEQLGRLEEALYAREQAIDIARPLWPDDDIRVASHVCGRAVVLAKLGRDREARAAFPRCLPTLALDRTPDDRDLAIAREWAARLGL